LRGGLLCHGTFPPDDDNVLQNLMNSYSGDNIIRYHHEAAVDTKCLQILKRLRRMGLVKKEDIRRYYLLDKICGNGYYFAEKRFRFLVEWDPTALTQINTHRYIPLHFATMHSIQGLRAVFEYGIRHCPKKTGICLLFKEDDDNITPFQIACDCNGYNSYDYDREMNAIKDTLRDCHRRCSEEDNNNTSGPYNIVDALITAAIDETIHLDCVYFLIRREPDNFHKLLSSKHTAAVTTVTTAAMVASDNINIDIDEGITDKLTSATKINPKMRKWNDRQHNNNDDDDDFI
jgi:hypothetical protein